MCYGNDSHTLYFAGDFDVIAGEECANVASYNSISRKWTCLSSAVHGNTQIVKTAHYHPFLNALIVGGDPYFVMNGVSCNGLCILQLNQSIWSSPAQFDDVVHSIASKPSSNEFFVCGNFQTIQTTSYLSSPFSAHWNGSTFVSFANEFNAICRTLSWSSIQSKLYAVGEFTQAGSESTVYVAYLENNVWKGLTASVHPNGNVYSIYTLDLNSILISGAFSNFGNIPVAM